MLVSVPGLSDGYQLRISRTREVVSMGWASFERASVPVEVAPIHERARNRYEKEEDQCSTALGAGVRPVEGLHFGQAGEHVPAVGGGALGEVRRAREDQPQAAGDLHPRVDRPAAGLEEQAQVAPAKLQP